MIADLKPCPAYKDSGVPWLGDVPEHWGVLRLKWCAAFNPSKAEARTLLTAAMPVTFLPMERVGADGRIDTSEPSTASAVWHGFTYFRRGDVLVAKITPCFENGKGACLDLLPTEIGFGSTEFHVLRAGKVISPRFLRRLTTVAAFRRLGADAMTGAAGQQRVPEAFIANHPISLPPLPEQAAIVRFLDHADRRIRRYIHAKQKLIKLLEEQKQAIIHQAVTRGLDPNVRLKPSGVEWLGDVPEHWGVLRLKWCAAFNPSKAEARTLLTAAMPVTFLPMERVGADGRIDTSEPSTASAVWHGFTYFRRGDVLVAKITPCFENGKGACLDLLPTEIGFGSTEFHVLRAGKVISPRFLHRLTTVAAFRRLGADAMTGAAGQQRVPEAFIANHPISLPPLPEQAAIVRFLDHADRRIRRYIHAKQKLIKLLEEQKQAIIHQAVTRGLDPNVRLKPSGVEWLGDVPGHWATGAAKRYYTIQLGKMLQGRPGGPDDIEIPYLKAQHVQWFHVRTAHLPKMWASERDITQFGVSPGDLLVCEGGEGGRCGLLKGDSSSCIIQNALHRVRPLGRNRNDFLQYVMSTTAATGWFDAINSKATIAHFTGEKFGALVVPIPPATEQAAIVRFLDHALQKADQAIDRAQRGISLLREYRTRLIADVVTGKLDVRAAAALLPDEVEEMEPVDKVDALGETEEDGDGNTDAASGEEEDE